MSELLVEELKVRFRDAQGNSVTAVDNVSLRVRAGEVVGLVGESGCGKSTLARTIVGLHRPQSGRIVWDGKDVTAARGRALRDYRREVQYVFQDPYASLSPRLTVQQTLEEALQVIDYPRQKVSGRIDQLLQLVGLPRNCAQRRPAALSGGQRQRVAIARALAVEPRFLICDEPVSALDVSIRAQVMNLLVDLQEELNLGYLFIAHDLGLVRRIAHRTLVMYLGQVVESGPSEQVYERTGHPYTRSLLASIPDADPDVQRARGFVTLRGELPSPSAPPPGCRFHTRCPQALDGCRLRVPDVLSLHEMHQSACFMVDAPASSGHRH
jgi:oligopeptide/dipeptide ABC transporter ATP-binding protein